jgi:hypothetical protein
MVVLDIPGFVFDKNKKAKVKRPLPDMKAAVEGATDAETFG